MAFSHACAPGARLSLGAVGDVLLHEHLQRQAVREPERFRSIWGKMEPAFEKVDIMYANLEGPVAPGTLLRGKKAKKEVGFRFDGEVYSSYPFFNYHPYVLKDLKTSGVDVVSVANNHAMDRSRNGVDRTVESLRQAGMTYTGIRKASPTAPAPWHGETQANGWTVAWLACTYGVNGLPDRKRQVLRCEDQKREVLRHVKALAARKDIDAIVLTPHWGWEMREMPLPNQRAWAREMVEAGVTMILGSHPHVLQPWEKVVTSGGREALVVYSLGNFVSNMPDPKTRTSAMVIVGLTKKEDGGSVVINGVRHLPLWMRRHGKRRFVEPLTHTPQDAPALGHVHSMFGSFNALGPAERPTPTPQCDPTWRPDRSPHPHSGGPGGMCTANHDCGPGATCDERVPGGFCTKPCAGRCGAEALACVALGTGIPKQCARVCEAAWECRAGTRCARAKGSRKKVCVPLQK